MVDILRAQLYRLVRSVTFWGFLGVAAFIAYAASRSVGDSVLAGASFGPVPSASSMPANVWMTVDAEEVLGAWFAPLYLCLFTSLVTAVFGADDVREGGLRSLAAAPRFRRDYVLASLVQAALVAAAMVLVAFVAAWLAFLPHPLVSVGFSGGCFARWALLVVLAAMFCAMATLLVLLVTGRKGVAALFALLLCGLALDNGLSALAALVGGEGLLSGIVPWLPLQIVSRVCVDGIAPVAADMVSPVLFAAVAALLCWLALRRKEI